MTRNDLLSPSHTDGPRRIQLSRAKGWRMPANTVKVTRPSIWGNPFVHSDTAIAVQAYRDLIGPATTKRFDMGPGKLQFAPNAHRNTLHWAYGEFVCEHINDLRGKNLACWCALDQPCHAEVLLELANGGAHP